MEFFCRPNLSRYRRKCLAGPPTPAILCSRNLPMSNRFSVLEGLIELHHISWGSKHRDCKIEPDLHSLPVTQCLEVCEQACHHNSSRPPSVRISEFGDSKGAYIETKDGIRLFGQSTAISPCPPSENHGRISGEFDGSLSLEPFDLENTDTGTILHRRCVHD